MHARGAGNSKSWGGRRAATYASTRALRPAILLGTLAPHLTRVALIAHPKAGPYYFLRLATRAAPADSARTCRDGGGRINEETSGCLFCYRHSCEAAPTGQ